MPAIAAYPSQPHRKRPTAPTSPTALPQSEPEPTLSPEDAQKLQDHI